MDRQRIYIGVYKNTNQESLFYQKGGNLFYDLKQKRNVSAEDIEDDLIPYGNIIKEERRFKKGIIKLYDLDRMQKISLNRVFIGNSYQVTEIISRKSLGMTNILSKYQSELLKKDILLFSSDSDLDYAKFTDIESGNCYESLFYPERGDVYISTDSKDLRLASKELGIHDTVFEKGKLLEKYREYKKRGINHES